MRIGFYYSFPLQRDWNDLCLESYGLAGSETALVHITRELAKENEVIVYNKTSKPGRYHGVDYYHLNTLDYSTKYDVFIVVRGPLPNLKSIKSSVKIYWSIEEDNVFIKDWENVKNDINAIITISPYHTKELCWRIGIDRRNIYETRLGICYEEYVMQLPKTFGKLIYCSAPSRGLEYALEIYKSIKSEFPQVSLVVTYDYSLWGLPNGIKSYCTKLSELDGINYLGRVNRERLIMEQKTSMIHLYPCCESELFCLSSIECQAAGTPTVATDLGALSTTVCDGYSGLLTPATYQGSFSLDHLTNNALELLRNPHLYDRLSKYARQRVYSDYIYKNIVAEWIEFFSGI